MKPTAFASHDLQEGWEMSEGCLGTCPGAAKGNMFPGGVTVLGADCLGMVTAVGVSPPLGV